MDLSHSHRGSKLFSAFVTTPWRSRTLLCVQYGHPLLALHGMNSFSLGASWPPCETQIGHQDTGAEAVEDAVELVQWMTDFRQRQRQAAEDTSQKSTVMISTPRPRCKPKRYRARLCSAGQIKINQCGRLVTVANAVNCNLISFRSASLTGDFCSKAGESETSWREWVRLVSFKCYGSDGQFIVV